jgi:membrane protein DedA with SNARE-associated domain
VTDLTVIYPYFLIFTMLLASGLGFPIPEEIPVITGGIYAGHPDSGVRWWIMLPVCIAGVVISDGFLYGIGRLWGPRLLQYRLIKSRLLPPDRLLTIEENFHKYGVKILLFARILPGIRSPIFITAGIMRLPFTSFVLADGLYAIPGVSLLFFLGYWFTDQFLEVVQKAESMRPLIVVVVLVAVGSYLFYHFVQRPVVTGDPHELPLVGGQMGGHGEEAKCHPAISENLIAPAEGDAPPPSHSEATH